MKHYNPELALSSHEALRARIAELEKHLAWMTRDRDVYCGWVQRCLNRESELLKGALELARQKEALEKRVQELEARCS